MSWGSVFKGFFASSNLYTWIGIVLLATSLLAGCVVAVTRAYDSIYDAGHKAGVTEQVAGYQQRLLEAQDKAMALQQELTNKAVEYGVLQAQFTALEAVTPEETIRYVRQDPKFAAARRPVDLHAQRIRQLQSLREAAAAH